jgi:hypothetical protein
MRHFFSTAQQPLVGRGFLIIKASRLHSNEPHSVGLLWTRDQSEAETSTCQHSQGKDIQAPTWFEPVIPSIERPQTYTLEGAATGIDNEAHTYTKLFYTRYQHTDLHEKKKKTKNKIQLFTQNYVLPSSAIYLENELN